MAKVPTYNPGQIQEQALPGVRQTNAIDGAFTDRSLQQFAKGAADMANVAANIAVRENQLLDADAVTRAEVAFKDAESEFRIDLGNRKGINAATAKADADKWYADQVKKHAEGLTNDTQRRGFERLTMQRKATFMDFAGRHQSAELENAWVGSKNANMQASINAVAAAGGDDAVIRQERGRIESNLADISARRGWTPEQLAQERGKTLTTMHSQVLQQLVESDPRRAHAYLDRFGSEIDGDKRAELEKFVRKGTMEADGRDLSLLTIGKGYNGGLAILKAEEDAAKKLASTGEREARLDVIGKARQFHNQEFAQREQQKNYNQRQASEQAYALIREGKNVPIGLRNAMDPHAALTLEKHLAGEKVQTDWKTYNDLRRQAVSDPAGFAQRDLYKDFDKLHPKEREALLDLQGKAIKGGDDIKDVATLSQQLSTAHNLLKFSKSDQEKKGLFDRAAQDAITEEQKTRGRKLNFEERQKVIDTLMVEGDTNGWMPGGGRRYFEVRGTSNAAKFEVNVPADDRKQIETALRAKGKPVSDAEIQRLYKKAKGM